jgi:hypothetical protein
MERVEAAVFPDDYKLFSYGAHELTLEARQVLKLDLFGPRHRLGVGDLSYAHCMRITDKSTKQCVQSFLGSAFIPLLAAGHPRKRPSINASKSYQRA